jgi:ABC-type oligopeptide transport system substrate-binding subunit
MITEYKDGHSQVYTKNPNNWDSEVINGKKYKLPFADKLYFPIIKDEATTIASLRTGKRDLAGMNWKYVDELKKSNPHLIWARILSTVNFSLCLRMAKKPFNDIRVRQALNMAVNKKEIISNFFNVNAEMHTYPFPPAFKDVYTPIEKLTPDAKLAYAYGPRSSNSHFLLKSLFVPRLWPIFRLDPVFPLFYTLAMKKNLLSPIRPGRDSILFKYAQAPTMVLASKTGESATIRWPSSV